MNLLIADSGGTKTDWCYITPKERNYFKSAGLHPAYISRSEIIKELNQNVRPNLVELDQVWFYGAGCYGPESASKIKKALNRTFLETEVNVFDDLTGAARAHLNQSNGTICVLGTGSICGRYHNGEITSRSAALGFAIGDEGSAADIGGKILKAFFRKELDEVAADRISSLLPSSEYAYWMDTIYGSRHPNRELASVAGTVLKSYRSTELMKLVSGCFEKFFDSQLASIKPDKQKPIVMTGKVAAEHSDLLIELLNMRNFSSASVASGIIHGLADYHTKDLS